MNDDNQGNMGNKGRFSERLKKIKFFKIRNKHKSTDDVVDESNVKNVARNILKVTLALPSIVYNNVIDNKKTTVNSINSENKLSNNTMKNENNFRTENQNNKYIINTKSVNQKKYVKNENRIIEIKKIDVSLIKKMALKSLSKQNYKKNIVDKETKNAVDYQMKIEVLQKEVINLIKKNLVENINELEILQSELYILNEIQEDSAYLNICQDRIKEIKKLLSKINSLKEKYDHLKDNVDFEYMLDYKDDALVDKILELKDICSNNDITYVVDNYKLLEEYKFLYLKIDKIQDDTIKLEEYKNARIEKLKERDIDFEKLKSDIYDVDRESDRYANFVSEQEIFLKNLDDKINDINSYEVVTYNLTGFNQLLGNSFRYLGLLLVSPLRGLIPSIAVQTLLTRNVVRNLYNNLDFEESRKMVYEAIDYSDSLNNTINNLDDMSRLVDSTLVDVMALKTKYKEKFSEYEKDFSSYKDAIKKINKIENAVMGSKIKINLMLNKTKENQKINDNKLKKVKKLNDSSSN